MSQPSNRGQQFLPEQSTVAKMLDILLAAFLEALRLTQLASVFLVIAYV